MAKKNTSNNSNKAPENLTPEQFTLRAIETLADTDKGYKAIHTVFSGFNSAFRDYFPGKDPVVEVKSLVAAGTIVSRPAMRGALIAKPGDMKTSEKNGGSKALSRMGLAPKA